jgi:hypothetical protein
MARTVTLPKVTTIALTDWDPSGLTTVTLREARFAESVRRSQFLSRYTVEQGYIGSREIREISGAKLVALELWLTYVSATIMYQGNDQEEPLNLFSQNLTEPDFMAVLDILPDDLILEWHTRVIEANPIWSS